ncbi:MAG TPA: DUF4190 domain-containing protein [Myxococcales bacterium]
MAQCSRHPEALATDLCVECGDCVCGQCAWVMPDRTVYCPNCKDRPGRTPPPPVEEEARPLETVPVARPPKPKPAAVRPWSPTVVPAVRPQMKNSKAAIAAVVLPFACCTYGAIIGLILAIRERKLVREGKSGSSMALVSAGIWINAIALALTFLMLLIPKK